MSISSDSYQRDVSLMVSTDLSSALQPADFGTRFAAFMIDTSLLFAAQWIVVIVASRQLQAVGLTSLKPCENDPLRLCEGPSTALWTALLLFLVISTIGYYALTEGRYGATPAKRWLGLEVIDDGGGRRIGLAAGVLRAVVRQAFWLSLFFVFDASPLDLSLPPVLFIGLPALAMAGVAYGAIAPDGRALHDIVAKTLVVHRSELPDRADASELNRGSQSTHQVEESEESEESV